MNSNEFYHSIIEYNPDAVFILSVDGTIVEVNQIASKMLGFSKGELQRKHYEEILVPECKEFTYLQYQHILLGESPEYETQLFHKNGEKVYLQVKNIPLWDNGEIVGIFGVGKNITELHKTKATLTEMEERIKSLFYSTGDAIDILDLEGNVLDVNPAFEELYGWRREEIIGRPLPIIPEYQYHQQEDLLAQAKYGKYTKTMETICIKKDGTPIEVSLTFSPILDQNSNVLGTAGITRDITEQKQLEKSLKESEEWSRKIVEFLPKGVIIHRNGVILYTNPTALKIVKEKNAAGKPITDYIDPKYHEISIQRLTKTTAELQELPMKEFELTRGDGEVIDIEVHSTTITFDGDIAVLTLIKDISDRTKMERNLKESLKNLVDVKFALDESSIVAITDQRGIIEYVNDKFCEISKYSSDELIGQDHRILNSGYHSKEYFKNMWKMIGNGKTWKGEFRNKAKDGRYYWVDTTIVPFLNDKGKPYRYISIRNDITERKQVEEALRQSEKRYQNLVNLSPEPIVVHSQGVIKYINQAGVQAFGATHFKKLLGKSILDFVHPDTRKNAIERIQYMQQAEGNTLESMVRLDGTNFYIEYTGIGTTFEGEPSMELIFHDITDKKLVEEALRQSEERYRLIAENMRDLICIIDKNGYLTYSSPSHESILGFPSEAYEGSLAFDWLHEEDIPIAQKYMEETFLTKEDRIFQFRFKNTKGAWVWFEAKVTPIFDDERKFRHFHVVSREITERRMYEEKLTYMAYHDTLTGLPNRRLFKERLVQSIKEAERYKRKMAVMYMDMDKFKQINDTLGHDVGDELLKQFAGRAQGCLRESDTLARQGGDEFTILLPEIQEEQDAVAIANRILESVQKPWQVEKYTFHTTSSIGIALYPDTGINGHDLMKYADKALYEVKENGKTIIKCILR